MPRRLVLAIISVLSVAVFSLAFFCQPNAPSTVDQKSQLDGEANCAERHSDTYINWWFGIRHSSDCQTDVLQAKVLEGGSDKGGIEKPIHQAYDSSLSVAEADLLAQERVAYWTFWISILTAVGLAALLWTLWLTREANRAARDAVDVTRTIGELQLRAHLSVETLVGKSQNAVSGSTKNPPRSLELTVNVRNFG